MENLSILIRLGLGFVAFGVVGGALGWSSYLTTKEDRLDETAGKWDEALAERTETANGIRYLVYLIPFGVVLLVIGGILELF